MKAAGTGYRVEAVWASLGDEAAAEVLAFWAAHGALDGSAARERLPEVVCLVRDGDGALVGVSSAFLQTLPRLGNHAFWVHRRFLAPDVPRDTDADLLNAAFDVLNAEVTSDGDGPVGMCVFAANPQVGEPPPEAVWPATRMLYAGYAKGRRVHVRYFDHVVLPGTPGHRELAPGYRIELLAECEAVSTDDVLDLWRREAVVSDEEAQRRIHEVLLVAVHDSGDLAGVYSAYVARQPRLRMDLWYTRGYVAAAHRLGNISVQLGYRGLEYLERRFVTGEDRRASGTLFELHNHSMRERFPQLQYTELDAHFVGDTPSGFAAFAHFFRERTHPFLRQADVVDLPEALAWLDTHTNFERSAPPRAGSVGGLSLDRMRALVGVLDEPQRQYPVIHLTGTNGKGSTARMAAALLAETGLSVGVYSSPHLQRVNERISRNGDPILDDELAALLTDLRGLVPLTGVEPSWFELVTAAAFSWFAEVAVDVAVVEVGMLGRYDATNVADGAVAVVTNIGPDHTDFREGWRLAVAEEKAGIVKPGSVLVLGETDQSLRSAFVAESPAEVWTREEEFGCDQNALAVGGRLLDLRTPNGTVDGVFLPLHGAHQGDNAACALAAAEALFGRAIDDDIVREAFAQVTMPGRFEVVGRDPLVVLDGAHNAAGTATLAQTLADDFEIEGERILVVGLLAPRDVESVLDALDASTAHLVIACTPQSPRAIPAAEVATASARLGVAAEVVPEVGRAVDRAIRRAGEGDAVVVTGSFYTVGEARTHLGIR